MAQRPSTYSPLRDAARREIRRTLAAVGLSGGAVLGVAIEHGFGVTIRPLWVDPAFEIMLVILALVAAGDLVVRARPPARWPTRTGMVAEISVAATIVAELLGVNFAGDLLATTVAVSYVVRLNAQLARTMSNPAALFPGSFLVLIGLTTGLLMLPAATPVDQPIGFVDALFTATSAVCVTGLTVRDTGTGFTTFGHVIIAAAIQLGGLGIMIFGSTLALLFGARLSFRENLTLSSALAEYPAHRISRFVGFIVLATLVIEAVGAVIMYLLWPESGLTPRERMGMAVFHSISSFCLAGFHLTGDSLEGMRGGALPYLTTMPLIVLGGIGFVVLDEIWNKSGLRRDGSTRRLSTHSRLVLATTLLLLVGGGALIFVAQLKVQGVPVNQRFLDAAFLSVTARTAGFNTMPMDELAPGSRFLLMVLMVFGGAPGSAAGGIKVTVLAVLALSVWATVRGRDEVEVFGRALPDNLVKKAAALAFGIFALIAVVTLILDMTEDIPFEPLIFEVISASTTTGLSLGATDDLTPAGRVVISLTMLVGRVGPLAFLGALIVKRGGTVRGGSYHYPRDSVSLG